MNFDTTFKALTDNSPFPWQRELYNRFVSDRTDNIPESCNLPTGLGKTSVIAVWLIALATHPDKLPRRLIYVVNRRTVVDQTTDEVAKYRRNLSIAGITQPLALSTLRGQFADNREWSADPSVPAVICGTVDMIGSRLLFSGYGIGMKARPLHAGFLGQDALLVHDEAHLEPAFQTLVEAIRAEQSRDFHPLRVMELTATSRGAGEVFGLTAKDHAHDIVKERVWAKKTIHLHELRDPKKLAEQIAEEALKFKDSGRPVLVFVRTVDDVMKVRDRLAKEKQLVETLTGTMRGKERDELVEKPIFRRFLPSPSTDAKGTVYLVCTSAGEVGVNISADHLVCDLSTYESMAQRYGRVNRFGKLTDTEIHVVYPTTFEDDEYDQRRKKTLALLHALKGDGSPAALSQLCSDVRQAAFAPTPTLLPATDILFDAWALTTIRDKLPGRPPVEPYLHGITEWQPPETHVAWRAEVETITGNLLAEHKPADLLEAYPLKPHELLKEPSYRAFKQFAAMAKRLAGRIVPVWLVDDNGQVEILTLRELADSDDKERIHRKTVLLPPSAGGLEGGMLSGTATAPESSSLDVADTADRIRVTARNGELSAEQREQVKELHLVRRIDLASEGDDEDAAGDAWLWFTRQNEGDKSAKLPVLWQVHVTDVIGHAERIVGGLPLDDQLRRAVIVAAKLHDHGKKRKVFQTMLGNTRYPNCWLAKSGKKGGRVKEQYRHEFGSLLDVEKEADFQALNGEQKELVLHLIAAHHGRARPHFPTDEAFDPERHQADADQLAAEVPQRFARLQRKYGRWGLAYLESLLRSADWAASGTPSAFVKEGE